MSEPVHQYYTDTVDQSVRPIGRPPFHRSPSVCAIVIALMRAGKRRSYTHTHAPHTMLQCIAYR